MAKQPVPGVHENFAGCTPAPESQTHVDGERKFCDFPECGCSSGAAERCSHPPVSNMEALEEIKYLALTAGAPGHTSVPKALARMIFLCNRAGVTKKLDDLRPLFATPGVSC